MSYENAPSTRLLAIHCCACGRALRDAKSVELGIGPICRGRYGHDAMVGAAERAEANSLVHGIAARNRMSIEERDRLVELGFQQLATRLANRLLQRSPQRQRPIEIQAVRWLDVDRLAVVAPYNANALPAWRVLGVWDRDSKRWMVHPRDSAQLLDMLDQHYPEHEIVGPEK